MKNHFNSFICSPLHRFCFSEMEENIFVYFFHFFMELWLLYFWRLLIVSWNFFQSAFTSSFFISSELAAPKYTVCFSLIQVPTSFECSENNLFEKFENSAGMMIGILLTTFIFHQLKCDENVSSMCANNILEMCELLCNHYEKLLHLQKKTD